MKDETVKAASISTLAMTAATMAPEQAQAAQEIAQLGMETNILGLVATLLFIIIPTSFLLILYVKSSGEKNVSGGMSEGSQTYYNSSKKAGNKKTNEAAVFKGKGTGMYSD